MNATTSTRAETIHVVAKTLHSRHVLRTFIMEAFFRSSLNIFSKFVTSLMKFDKFGQILSVYDNILHGFSKNFETLKIQKLKICQTRLK